MVWLTEPGAAWSCTCCTDVEQLKQQLGVRVANVAPLAKAAKGKCIHCGAKFKENLKFCGQCGKPMEAA